MYIHDYPYGANEIPKELIPAIFSENSIYIKEIIVNLRYQRSFNGSKTHLHIPKGCTTNNR